MSDMPELPWRARKDLELTNKTEEELFFSGPLFDSYAPNTRAQWHIPWSDLMMTMFVLFAVMYVYGSFRKPQPTQESRPKTDPSISMIYEYSKEALKRNHLENLASVELMPDNAVKILLTSDLLFDTGSAVLKKRSIKLIKQLASILRKTPHIVEIVGHTDDVPIHTKIFPSNWELSTARACAVARFLIEKMNISPERLRVTGFAEYRPIRPNFSSADRAANRRVEITIKRENL